MSQVYRTAGLDRETRFQYWRDLMCREIVPAHGSASLDDGFDAQFTITQLGPVTVCSMSAPLQYWDRDPHYIRSAPRDVLLLTLLRTGRGHVFQDGKDVDQTPGTIVVYDTSKPFSYELQGETVIVKIPRHALLARLPDWTGKAPIGVSARSPIGALASTIIERAATLDLDADAPERRFVGSSLLEIIAALMSTECPPPLHCPSAAALHQVERYIRDNLGDPDLCVASIANANGISERNLFRLFATTGVTPMRWALRERLAASHRMLAENAGVRVSDVALTHGFSELSHFCRTFKAAYGYSPRQTMEAARTCGTAKFPPISPSPYAGQAISNTPSK